MSKPIDIRDLTIGYGERVVQEHLTLCMERGELVCMLGRNGCGKSTLLRTLAGLQPALGGTYHIDDVAVVLTDKLRLDNTTVRDVVAMGRYPYTSFLGKLTAEDEKVVDEALEEVFGNQYSVFSGQLFNALSDGEKQRVLIAKALAQQTDVILLDEPTAHLDLPNRILVLQLLRRLAHEQGKTILISTHELELALRLSDRILLMSDKGVELDTAARLKQADAFTKAFGMDIF
ncbi:MAG: ABC transporter ATP-binding protein, partial [Paludibacteraceae bacterium]|nr:ABC transporter ATP-binding protein [Paludibacteraceae bacterium]